MIQPFFMQKNSNTLSTGPICTLNTNVPSGLNYSKTSLMPIDIKLKAINRIIMASPGIIAK